MNFGTVKVQSSSRGDYWAISCEPHVRNRLRRVFPQVSQSPGDTILLSMNPENARDLLWFTERYPMGVDKPTTKGLKQLARAHEETESAVQTLLSAISPPEDFELALPARDYQKLAASLLQLKSGLLLADDVGLGKTVSAICSMCRKDNLPVLVVTLTHLPEQWAAEIAKFAPELKVHILKSGKTYPLVKARKGDQSALFEEDVDRMPDVIISNYHKLNGWAETLACVVKYVVFDEAQELRHDSSNKYVAAKHIAGKAKLRIGLSATPIYNMGNEFFNVLEILAPGALGTYEEFHREWCGEEGVIKDPKAFGAYLRREGLMLRRTRKDVGRELPPFSNILQTIQTDQRVLDQIRSSAVELAKVILASQQNYRGEKFQASEEFNMLLRKATGVSKAPYVAEFVRMLLSSEQKIVLFGWHRDVYAIWMDLLAEFKPVLYSGSESPKQKMEAKAAFVQGDSRVMIISLRAGAGLDGLQNVCRVGVFGEIDWSPGVHIQCGGRYYRDGQDEPSMAYYLLSEDGSDPVIADLLGLKKGQIEGVVDPDADLVEQLAVEPGSIKKLAKVYLQKLGVTLPEAEQIDGELLAA